MNRGVRKSDVSWTLVSVRDFSWVRSMGRGDTARWWMDSSIRVLACFPKFSCLRACFRRNAYFPLEKSARLCTVLGQELPLILSIRPFLSQCLSQQLENRSSITTLEKAEQAGMMWMTPQDNTALSAPRVSSSRVSQVASGTTHTRNSMAEQGHLTYPKILSLT